MRNRITVEHLVSFLTEMGEHLEAILPICEDQQVKNVLSSYSRQIRLLDNEYAMQKSRDPND